MIRFHPRGLLTLLVVIGLVAVASSRTILLAPLAIVAGAVIDWASLIVPFVPGARGARSK